VASFCRFAIGPGVGVRPAGRVASFCRFALDPAEHRGLAGRVASFCRFALDPAEGRGLAGRVASFCCFALDPAEDRGLAGRVASFCRIAIGRDRVGAGRAGRTRGGIGRAGRVGRLGSRVGTLGDVRVLRLIADRPPQPGQRIERPVQLPAAAEMITAQALPLVAFLEGHPVGQLGDLDRGALGVILRHCHQSCHLAPDDLQQRQGIPARVGGEDGIQLHGQVTEIGLGPVLLEGRFQLAFDLLAGLTGDLEPSTAHQPDRPGHVRPVPGPSLVQDVEEIAPSAEQPTAAGRGRFQAIDDGFGIRRQVIAGTRARRIALPGDEPPAHRDDLLQLLPGERVRGGAHQRR
jgi:hypothetical protein